MINDPAVQECDATGDARSTAVGFKKINTIFRMFNAFFTELSSKNRNFIFTCCELLLTICRS